MRIIVAVVLASICSAIGTMAGVASNNVVAVPAAASAPVTAFMSPSGNIRCRYFPSAATIGCLTLNNNIETMMRATGQPYAQKVSHNFPRGDVLAYGASRRFARDFKCTSRKEGMFCRSLLMARCFLAAREGQQLTCSPTRSGGATQNPVPTPPPPTDPPPPPPPSENCHPSYEGACLDPNASDYDCAGGSGNGPRYTGPVRVVGPDVFDLDADGDGVGCE